MRQLGFKQGKATACAFHNVERNIHAVIHGDDFIIIGRESSLKWMEEEIREKYEVKTEWLGGKSWMKKEVHVLNRRITWADTVGHVLSKGGGDTRD
eukprot:704905-Karenia_brevis.AAC.1